MEKQSINQDQAIEERNPNEPIFSKKRNWKFLSAAYTAQPIIIK
jgi:hypothetical protein